MATEEVDVRVFRGAMLPFVGGRSVSGIVGASAGRDAREGATTDTPGKATDETAYVDIRVFRRPALPFPEGVPPAPVSSTDGPVDEGTPAARTSRAESIATTEEIDVHVFRGASLPFAASLADASAFRPVKAPLASEREFAVGGEASRASGRERPVGGDDSETVVPSRGHAPVELVSGVVSSSRELSLEDYASCRACLALMGEDNTDVWTRFGVSSSAAKESIRARFAERFRRDPALQAWFVELVNSRTAELRAKLPR
jgi:hypothetical protein